MKRRVVYLLFNRTSISSWKLRNIRWFYFMKLLTSICTGKLLSLYQITCEIWSMHSWFSCSLFWEPYLVVLLHNLLLVTITHLRSAPSFQHVSCCKSACEWNFIILNRFWCLISIKKYILLNYLWKQDLMFGIILAMDLMKWSLSLLLAR